MDICGNSICRLWLFLHIRHAGKIDKQSINALQYQFSFFVQEFITSSCESFFFLIISPLFLGFIFKEMDMLFFCSLPYDVDDLAFESASLKIFRVILCALLFITVFRRVVVFFVISGVSRILEKVAFKSCLCRESSRSFSIPLSESFSDISNSLSLLLLYFLLGFCWHLTSKPEGTDGGVISPISVGIAGT